MRIAMHMTMMVIMPVCIWLNVLGLLHSLLQVWA